MAQVWNWQFSQATWNLIAANNSVHNDGDPYHLDCESRGRVGVGRASCRHRRVRPPWRPGTHRCADDNCGNQWYWGYRRVALQAKLIADAFVAVFGADNVGRGKRVRPVLAGQVRVAPEWEGLGGRGMRRFTRPLGCGGAGGEPVHRAAGPGLPAGGVGG
jgi:hypothetical protein